MSYKSEKQKKKSKKEKKKNLIVQEINSNREVQEITKKSNIFSMLNRLDNIDKAKGQMEENKLRKGIIESEQLDKIEKIEAEKLDFSKIRKEIEKLNELKNRYFKEGEFDKAIEISEKIVVIAFSNKLKSLINEENKFIEFMRNKKIQTSANTEMFEEDKVIDSIKKEHIENVTIKQDVNLKLDLTEVQEKQKLKEDKIKFEKEKEKFKQEKLKFEEEKEAFKWEKQMFEEVKKFERDQEIGIKKKNARIEIEKVESEEKEEFDVDTDFIEKERQNLEEEKKKFKADKLKFKEEKDKFEQEKLNFGIEKEKLKQEIFNFGEQKDTFEKNWEKFQEDKDKLAREKQKFEEERDALKWEKEMFEEVKKYNRDKESP